MKQQNPVILLNNLTATLGKKGLFRNTAKIAGTYSQDFTSIFNSLKTSLNSSSKNSGIQASKDLISNLKNMNFITDSGIVNEKLVSILPVNDSAKKKISQFLKKLTENVSDNSESKIYNSNIRSLSSSYAQMSSESVPQTADISAIKKTSSENNTDTEVKSESTLDQAKKKSYSKAKSHTHKADVKENSALNNLDNLVEHNNIATNNLNSDSSKKNAPNGNSRAASNENHVTASKNFAEIVDKTAAATENVDNKSIFTTGKDTVKKDAVKLRTNEKVTDNKISSLQEQTIVSSKKRVLPEVKSEIIADTVGLNKKESTENTKPAATSVENIKKTITTSQKSNKITANVRQKEESYTNSDKITSQTFEYKSSKDITENYETRVNTENINLKKDGKVSSQKISKAESENKAGISSNKSDVNQIKVGSSSKSASTSRTDNSETYKFESAVETANETKTVENTVDSKTGKIIKTEQVSKRVIKNNPSANGSKKISSKQANSKYAQPKHRNSVLSYLKSSNTSENKTSETLNNSFAKGVEKRTYLHRQSRATEELTTTEAKQTVSLKSVKKAVSSKTASSSVSPAKSSGKESVIRNTIVKTILMKKAESNFVKSDSKTKVSATISANLYGTGKTQRVATKFSNRSGSNTARLSNVNMQAVSERISNFENQNTAKNIETSERYIHLSEKESVSHKNFDQIVNSKSNITKNATATKSDENASKNLNNDNINVSKNSAENKAHNISLKQTNMGTTNTLNREPVPKKAVNSVYSKTLNQTTKYKNTDIKGVDTPQNFSKESKYSFDVSEVVSPLNTTTSAKDAINTDKSNVKAKASEPVTPEPIKTNVTTNNFYAGSRPNQKQDTVIRQETVKSDAKTAIPEKRNNVNESVKAEAPKTAKVEINTDQSSIKAKASEQVTPEQVKTNVTTNNFYAGSRPNQKQDTVIRQETVKSDAKTAIPEKRNNVNESVKAETPKTAKFAINTDKSNVKAKALEPVTPEVVKTNVTTNNVKAENRPKEKMDKAIRQETVKSDAKTAIPESRNNVNESVKAEAPKTAKVTTNTDQSSIKAKAFEPVTPVDVKTNITTNNVKAESRPEEQLDKAIKQETVKSDAKTAIPESRNNVNESVKAEAPKTAKVTINTDQSNIKAKALEPVTPEAVKTNVTTNNIKAESRPDEQLDKTIRQETVKSDAKTTIPESRNNVNESVKAETAKLAINTDKSNVKAKAFEPFIPEGVKTDVTNNVKAESRPDEQLDKTIRQETGKTDSKTTVPESRNNVNESIKAETPKTAKVTINTDQSSIKAKASEQVTPEPVKTNITTNNVKAESRPKEKLDKTVRQETGKTDSKTTVPESRNNVNESIKAETPKTAKVTINTDQSSIKAKASEQVTPEPVKTNITTNNVKAESRPKEKLDKTVRQETGKTDSKTAIPESRNNVNESIKAETPKTAKVTINTDQSSIKAKASEQVTPEPVKTNITTNNVKAESRPNEKLDKAVRQETGKTDSKTAIPESRINVNESVKAETAKSAKVAINTDQSSIKAKASESVTPEVVKTNVTTNNVKAESRPSEQLDKAVRQETGKTDAKTTIPESRNNVNESVKAETPKTAKVAINSDQSSIKAKASESVTPEVVKTNVTTNNVKAESRPNEQLDKAVRQETGKTDAKTTIPESNSKDNLSSVETGKKTDLTQVSLYKASNAEETIIKHEYEAKNPENVMQDNSADKRIIDQVEIVKSETQNTLKPDFEEKNNFSKSVSRNDSSAINEKRLFYTMQNSFQQKNTEETAANHTILRLDDEESISKFLTNLKIPDLEKLHTDRTQSSEPTQSNYVRRPESKNESMNNSSDNNNQGSDTKQSNPESFNKNDSEVFRNTLHDYQLDNSTTSGSSASENASYFPAGKSINQIYDKIFNELKSFEINSKSSLFKEADFKLRTDDFGEITANLVKENNSLQVTISVKNEAHLQTLREQLSDMNKSLEKLGFDEVEVNYRFDNEEHQNQHSHNRHRTFVNRKNVFQTLKEENETQQLMSMKRENTTIEYII